MTRPLRNLLAAGTLAAAALGGTAVVATGQADREPDRQAKNIILLIGDGMGVTHIDAARQRYYGADGRLQMERQPSFGSVTTYAIEQNSDKPELVTDSASSATAWSSGVKTYNAAIGLDAYGNRVDTIMEEAKAAGLRTGNVSTAEITDATPAAMFSHVSQRACQGPDFSATACQAGETPIAEQIASNQTADVIMGGGLSRFEPDDEAKFRANGYTVAGSFGQASLAAQTAASQRVATRSDVQRLGGRNRKVVALFNRGNMTVEKAKSDRPNAAEAAEPSLPEMTRKAISLLQQSDQGRQNGFFLQVEGALIDKRSHANDAAQTLGEMKAFDDAVAAALAFARKDGNTLVITTADHECAGFNIIGKGSFVNAEAAGPPVNVDSSNPANNSTPTRPQGQSGSTGPSAGGGSGSTAPGSGGTGGGQGGGQTTVEPTFRGNTRDTTRSTGTINGTGSGDPNNFGPATFRTADDPAGVRDGSADASLWLSYLSGNHTGQDVNIYASGPSNEAFDDTIDNTDIYFKMRRALRGLGD